MHHSCCNTRTNAGGRVFNILTRQGIDKQTIPHPPCSPPGKVQPAPLPGEGLRPKCQQRPKYIDIHITSLCTVSTKAKVHPPPLPPGDYKVRGEGYGMGGGGKAIKESVIAHACPSDQTKQSCSYCSKDSKRGFCARGQRGVLGGQACTICALFS